MKKLSLFLILGLFVFLACAQNALADVDPIVQAVKTAKMYNDSGLKAVNDNDIETQFKDFNSCIYYCEIATDEVMKAFKEVDKNDTEAIALYVRIYDFVNALEAISYMGIGNYYLIKYDYAKYLENYEQAKEICLLMMAFYSKNDINKEDQEKWLGLYHDADKTGSNK